jgi:nucleoid-associated protein EbfC
MNIMKMMKQAQDLQKNMGTMQATLAQQTLAAEVGGGAVKGVFTGTGLLQSVDIDPSLLNAAEKTMLEDLIVALVNQGKQKADELAAVETKKLMGGMNLPPGLSLPF